MSVFLHFGKGDGNGWEERIREALNAEFPKRDMWGHVEVELHYTAGRGFQILRAQYFPAAVGSVGAGVRLPVPDPPEDYTTRVRTVLERIGAPIAR